MTSFGHLFKKEKEKKERLLLVLELVPLLRLTISAFGNLHVQVEAEFDELSFYPFSPKKKKVPSLLFDINVL